MSKEQIEEMADILCEAKGHDCKGGNDCLCVKQAEALYNAGYRKQSEIIMCKDCAVPHNKWTGCPKLNGLVTSPYFYCALAEPKMKGGAE